MAAPPAPPMDGKDEAPPGGPSTAANGDAGLTHFTFAVDLWDCFDKVYRRVSKGRHDLKHLKAYLDVRSKLEATYGRELKTASTLAEFSEASSLSKCWADMREAGVQMAKQHSQFGTTCNEVSVVLEKLIGEIKTNKGKLREKYTKLEKDRATRQAAHQKARDLYVESVKQAETAVINRDAGRSQNFPDKQMTKLEQTMKAKMKDVERSNADYQKCVTQLKEAQMAFDTGVLDILQKFEEMEKNRLRVLQEQVARFSQAHDFMKGAITQICLILSKGVADIHVARDIQDFITKNTEKKKPANHVAYIPCNSEILNHAGGGGATAAVRSQPPPSEEKKAAPPAKKVEEKVAANIPVPPPMNNDAPAQNSSKKRYARAAYDFSSEEADDLAFTAGALVELESFPEADDWWRGTLNGKTGMFPKAYVELLPEGEGPPRAAAVGAPPDAPAQNQPAAAAAAATPAAAEGGETPKLMDARCQALFDFDGQDGDELSFKQGDTLIITGELNGWFLGKTLSGDRVGIFPSNYVKLN